MMKREAERRKQRRRERELCPVHGYPRHGKEAEELRKGVEALLAKYPPHTGWDETTTDTPEAYEGLRNGLTALLDNVDARDSLAYLERLRTTPRRSAAPKT